jgi:transcriptional regulator with XRE-family HTH domain
VTALNLKLYYLRTREKKLSQQAVAEALDVRQATLSHLERGQSAPNAALLLALCRFYDVTPTWLLDEEREIPPLATERWRARNGLVTTGMWVEVPTKSVVRLGNGTALCPLLSDAAFYDEEAATIRRSGKGEAFIRAAMNDLHRQRAELQAQLTSELAGEQTVHPRHRDATRRGLG